MVLASSPDGSRIAFFSNRGGEETPQTTILQGQFAETGFEGVFNSTMVVGSACLDRWQVSATKLDGTNQLAVNPYERERFQHSPGTSKPGPIPRAPTATSTTIEGIPMSGRQLGPDRTLEPKYFSSFSKWLHDQRISREKTC
jgi:hypothetical protein